MQIDNEILIRPQQPARVFIAIGLSIFVGCAVAVALLPVLATPGLITGSLGLWLAWFEAESYRLTSNSLRRSRVLWSRTVALGADAHLSITSQGALNNQHVPAVVTSSHQKPIMLRSARGMSRDKVVRHLGSSGLASSLG